MKYRILVFLMVALGVSCSTKKQLYKEYNGQSESILKEEFGEPKTILERETEKVYVYEVEEELESTEISQGKLTLDPIVTPKVIKTKRYFFTIKNGIITEIKMEEEYER